MIPFYHFYSNRELLIALVAAGMLGAILSMMKALRTLDRALADVNEPGPDGDEDLIDRKWREFMEARLRRAEDGMT